MCIAVQFLASVYLLNSAGRLLGLIWSSHYKTFNILLITNTLFLALWQNELTKDDDNDDEKISAEMVEIKELNFYWKKKWFWKLHEMFCTKSIFHVVLVSSSSLSLLTSSTIYIENCFSPSLYSSFPQDLLITFSEQKFCILIQRHGGQKFILSTFWVFSSFHFNQMDAFNFHEQLSHDIRWDYLLFPARLQFVFPLISTQNLLISVTMFQLISLFFLFQKFHWTKSSWLLSIEENKVTSKTNTCYFEINQLITCKS